MSFAIKRKPSPEMEYTSKLFILFSLMLLAKCELLNNNTNNTLVTSTTQQQLQPTVLNKHLNNIENSGNAKKQSNDMEEFENVLLEYAKDVINRDKINIVPGVYIQKKTLDDKSEEKSFDDSFLGSLRKFTKTHALRVDLARATTATGRLFFFKGNYEI